VCVYVCVCVFVCETGNAKEDQAECWIRADPSERFCRIAHTQIYDLGLHSRDTFVAVGCSVVQYVAVWYSTLQCVSVR